jgi:hypothetical protein
MKELNADQDLLVAARDALFAELDQEEALFTWPCGCRSPITGGDVVVTCDICLVEMAGL